jgi:hypothetical protein
MRTYYLLATNTSGIVAATQILGVSLTSLSDFTNFATVFSRFAITAATVTLFPLKVYIAPTAYIEPLSIGFLNDGILALPSSYDQVLAYPNATVVNPQASESFGVKLHFNPKATLDPWVPTTGYTSAQEYQYGGIQFYSTNSVISTYVWGYLLDMTVVFADKV